MTSSALGESRKARIIPILREVLEETSGIDINEFDETVTFFEMGMDSLFLTQVSMALSKKFSFKINFRQLLEDYTNLEQLSQFIDTSLPPEALPAQIIPATPSIAAAPVIAPATSSETAIPSPRIAAPLTLPTFESYVPPATAGAIEQLISQQLQLMARQIEVLGGASSRPSVPTVALQNVAVSSNIDGTQLPLVTESQPQSQKDIQAPHPEEAPKPFGAIARITLSKDNVLTPHQSASYESITNRYISRTIGSKRLAQANRSFLAEPRVVSGFTPLLKEIVYPIHVNLSSGCRLWDVDGNEYVDILCGFGSNFFGNVPQFITDALRAQLDKGMEIGPIHTLAGEVGKLFCEMTNSERVAFCNTGSEAVLGAMRVARTVTGRSKIAIFANSYHGIFDEVIVRGSKKLRTTPAAPGIMPECVQNVIVLDYGTPEALEIIRQKAKDGELAAVLCEPVQSRHPALQPREFLHEVRKITEETDTALIFDEVITGLRICQGGAQEYFGVKADLATYGKVIGGGLPLGVIAGKKKWMDALDGGFWSFGDTSTPEVGVTYFAGTFVRHPLALASAKAVLLYLKKEGPELQKRVNERTSRFVGELNAWFIEVGAPIHIEHFATQFKIIFTQEFAYSELLTVIMRTKGIHILDGFPAYLSLAHTEEDITFVQHVFKEAVLEMQEADFMPGNNKSLEMHRSLEADYPITIPSTESQREIWTSVQRGEDASLAYNEAISISFKGKLDLPALIKSIQSIVYRHDSLRITFSNDGTKVNIAAPHELSIEEVDLSNSIHEVAQIKLQSLFDEAVLKPFNLQQGPLFRAKIVKIDNSQHILILAAHHIICDGWSYAVILRELGTIYEATITGKTCALDPPDSYCSYALTMSTREKTPEFIADENFWRERFSTPVSLLDFPTDNPYPKRKTFSSIREDYILPADLVQAVKKAGAKQGCSFFVTMLTAFNVLLHRLSGQDEIVVGIASAGQSAVGKYNLVGHCVNILPIRSSINSGDRFFKLLNSVKKTVLDAQDHQQYTYGTILQNIKTSRDPARLPLVSVIFNIDQSVETDNLGFIDLATTVSTIPRKYENFEIFVNAVEDKGNVILEIQFNSDLYTSQTIRDRFGCFETILKSFLHNDDLTLAQIQLLSNDNKSKILVDWNNTEVDYYSLPIFKHLHTGDSKFMTLHGLIEKSVENNPDRIAVSYEDNHLNYNELDERANQLAHYLRQQKVGINDLVAVMMDRSIEMIIALCAIIKSGGAYLPLDPEHPLDRIKYILDESQSKLVLSQHRLKENLPDSATVFFLDTDWQAIAHLPKIRISNISEPDHLAYVIYTSGSTGQPKGVMNEHGGICNRLLWMQEALGLSQQDKVLQKTPYTFDVSVWEFFLPLIAGTTLVIAKPGGHKDSDYLVKTIQNENISYIHFVPSMLYLFLSHPEVQQCSTLKRIICSGEALSRELQDKFFDIFPNSELHNLYGPTEAAVDVTAWQCNSADQSSIVPIGRPVANTQIYLLDKLFQPVPVGVPGDLYIGGVQVARGYLNRSDLTAERFIPDPFSNAPGARIYMTGDLGRYRPDGVIEYLGRNDFQVKIRGLRIELGEIEAVLAQHSAIERCVVTAREDRANDQRLVAYLILKDNIAVEASSFREFIQSFLPDYMIPQHFIFLESFPMTSSGKIDRKLLPAPDLSLLVDESNFVPPATQTEEKLTELWCEILGLERLGVTDDFFELGGHSLLGIQMLAKINSSIGISLGLNVLFQSPTIRQIAELIDQSLSTGETKNRKLSIPKRNPESVIPASSQQRRMWILSQQNATAFRLRGRLNIKAIQETFDMILDRHEVLRTNICITNGELIQLVRPAVHFNLTPAPLEQYSVTSSEQLIAKLMEKAAKPVDTENDPLFSVELAMIAEDDYILMLIVNQIIFDGWSYDLLFDEFCTLYNALSTGHKPALSELPVQYGDYSIWQRDWLQSDHIQQQIYFWADKLGSDIPILSLPLDYERPSVQTFEAAEVRYRFDTLLTDALENMGKQHGCTLFTVIIALYAVLLHRFSLQKDIIIGTPISGRNTDELNQLIGYFVNTLTIKFSINPEMSFSSWLGEVKNICIEAYNNQDAPFELIVQKINPPRDRSRSPVFQTVFIYQDVRNRDLHLNNIEMDNCKIKRTTVQTDLDVWVKRENDDIWGGFIYPTALFKQETAQLFADTFAALAKQVSDQPSKRISDLVKENLFTHIDTTPGDDNLSLSTEAIDLNDSPEERYLIDLCKELLNEQNISTQDNFFNLGGDSFQAIQMIGRIEKDTGKKFNPRLILLNTLGQIALRLKSDNTSTDTLKSDSTMIPNRESEPFYFYNNSNQLYGVMHHPINTNSNYIGVLICAPIGLEYIRTHWIIRQLIDQLCNSGYSVLRFDYTGCGDSSGLNFEGGVQQWVRDTQLAEQELRIKSGCLKTVTLGVRFGAMIASQANLDSALVFWDPVEQGAEYLKGLVDLQKEIQLNSPSHLKKSSQFDLMGFEFSDKLLKEIGALNNNTLFNNAGNKPLIIRSSDLNEKNYWIEVNKWNSAILSGKVVQALVKAIQEIK